MAKEHRLKTDPVVFQATWEGSKTFEIRKNDRNFKPGDFLLLRETKHSGQQMESGHPLEYTGREALAQVGYVLLGGKYGLADGWVVLSVSVKNSYEL